MDLFESVEDVLRSKITEFVHAECKQYPQLEAQITYVAPGTASKPSWLMCLFTQSCGARLHH